MLIRTNSHAYWLGAFWVLLLSALSASLLPDPASLQAIRTTTTSEGKRLAALAVYDSNATFAPEMAKASVDRLSCMGRPIPCCQFG